MRFRLIDGAKKEFPVQRLCKVLGVSQSGYFARKDRPACRRQHENMVLLAHIRSAFALSNATYGSPRMTRELRDDGITIGRHRVARLMRENALKARQRRRFKRTTDSLHAFPVAPNLLNQDFNATGPNQKWGADISYVWTCERWLYLAVVIDLFARRVVGWAAGDRLHKELALLALRRAVAVRCPSAGLIHHADRGTQYCSVEYQAELRKNGISISMSGKGNCFDNAMVETFFKTLKAELVWRTIFQSRIEAASAIGRYIDGFYNVSSEHTSRYVVDAKRLCWATSCSAGCFEDLEDSSASLRAVGPLRSGRLKTQGPSGRGWIALTSLRSAASRRVRGATPTTAAAWLRFSQSSSPSDVSRNTGMRWLDRSEVTRSRVQRLP